MLGIFHMHTDVNACHSTRGHRKRVCTESWLWEKNPLPHRESNLPQRRAGPTLYQLSYNPRAQLTVST